MSMYLDVVQPKITGESKSTPSHPNWNAKIEIQHMSYHTSQTTSQQAGSGLSSSGSKVSHMQISKTMDKSTPMLFGHLAAGTPIDDMFIRVSRPGMAKSKATDDGLFEAETYELKNVIVSSYSTSGSPGPGGLPMEDWSFSFTYINETYQTVDNTGKLIPSGVHGFDFGLSQAV